MNTWLAPDGGVLSLSRKRSEVEIKYYFIDFGLSTEFALAEQRDRLVTGELGRIVAPEQNFGFPYDPFKLDVYYLGYVYQTKIVDVRFLPCLIPFKPLMVLKVFKGLDILGDLVRLMMKPEAKDRPSACEILTIWKSLRSLPSMPPRWTRLRTTQEEGSIDRIVNDALDVVGMVRGSMGL